MSFFKKDKSGESGDSSDIHSQIRKIADHLVFLEKKIDTLLEQSRGRKPFSNNGGFNRGFQNRNGGGHRNHNNHGHSNGGGRDNRGSGDNRGNQQFGRPHSARDTRYDGRDNYRSPRNKDNYQGNRGAHREGNIQPSQEPAAESNE